MAKKFFRVRLSAKCAAEKKMINGIMLTRQWQVRTGDIGAFAKFPDVETQAVAKQGNGFVPVESAGDSAQLPAQNAEGNRTARSPEPAEFTSMNVEQLKNYLTANGVPQSELRNATKPELIERAEFIWSQGK
jgi:hypothetical protein